MDASRRSALERLIDQNEVAALVLALEALAQEQGPDHDAVLGRAFVQLARHAERGDELATPAMNEVLSSTAVRLGPSRFLELALDGNHPVGYYERILPAVRSSSLGELSHDALERVLELAVVLDPGPEAAAWFRDAAGSSAEHSDRLLHAPLRRIGGLDDMKAREGEFSELVASFDHSNQLVSVRDRVLVEADVHRLVLVGLFRVLSASSPDEHVESIGPFVEDAGAWMRVSRAVFTEERIAQLATALERTGVVASVRRATERDADALAGPLASDPRFHVGVARLVGGRSSFFAVARTFTDGTFGAAIRSLVRDEDAPLRLAAVEALARSASKDAAPYLVAGVMDRDQKVREASRAALHDLLGEEAYQAQMESLRSEVGGLRARAESLGDWAKGALHSIEGSLSDMLGGIRGAPRNVGTAARRLFARKGVDDG